MPDLDRVIALSDYFDVTTDYLLKGIQPSAPQAGRQAPNASVFAIAGTAFNVIGLAAACGTTTARCAALAQRDWIEEIFGGAKVERIR